MDQHPVELLSVHLLECAGQLTGGYFADPGYKDVPGLDRLGFPIAEIDQSVDRGRHARQIGAAFHRQTFRIRVQVE